jgi:HSP20 family molecular chaperone IbpA
MPPPSRRTTLVRAVTALLPELSSVRLRETESELVVEVDVPSDVALPQLAARLRDGVLTITVPRTQPEADG